MLCASQKQLNQDGAAQAPESRKHQEAEDGVGVISAHGQGDGGTTTFGTTTSFDGITPCTPGSTTIASCINRGPSLPEAAVPAGAEIKPRRSRENRLSPEHDCGGNISAPDDGSSSITDRLRQILDQARSIRTKEASSCRSRASTARPERSVAAERSQTATPRLARESSRVASNSVNRTHLGASPPLGAGRINSNAKLTSTASNLNPIYRERSTTRTTRSRHAESDSGLGRSAREQHTAPNAAPTYVTPERSGAALPAAPTSSRVTRCSVFESHSADVHAASPQLSEGGYGNTPSEGLELSTEVTASLMNTILEESVRFMVSRARFLRSRASSSHTGSGPNKAAEDALLLALESEPSRKTEAHVDQRAWADPHFAARPDMLPRGSPSDCEGVCWEDKGRRSGVTSGSVLGRDSRRDCGPSARGVKRSGKGGSGGWDEVEQLQRSLLMLLEEVDGGRQVAAANERLGRTAQGWDGGEEDHAGTHLSRRYLEDWYGWNKVRRIVRRGCR